MRRLRRTWQRILGTLSRSRQEDELTAEIESHLQLHIDEHLRRGVPLDEARRLARLRLGGVDATKDAYRDQRGLPLLDALIQDVRYTGRLVRRHPTFYISLILILGSTLGLSIVMFSVVHAILWTPLPYAQIDRLVRVHELTPDGRTFAASAENVVAWRGIRGVYEGLAVFSASTFELTGTATPERVQGARVSANLFDLLGTRASIGRTFAPGEDAAGRPDIVLISHGLWKRSFGGRPEIVGQTVRVDGRPHVVIGVLPPAFEFPASRNEFAGGIVDMIAPVEWTPETWTVRGNHLWRVIGRLHPDTTLPQSREAMSALAAQLSRTVAENRGWGVFVEPLTDSIFGRTARVLSLLLAGVAALLLVGCANVANLLLARGVARRREFVVRTSLGGSARRLTRQVLTESLALAAAGAALGLALAHGGLQLFFAMAPSDLPRLEQVSIDARTLIATCLVAVVTAVLFGVAPAAHAGRARPIEALRGGGRGSISGVGLRVQSILVAGQIATTVILLIGAGLLVRSAILLQQTPTGLDATGIITARVDLDDERYPGEDGQWQFLERVLARVEAIPGVQRASAVSHPPLVWGDSLLGFYIEGERTGAERRIGTLRYSISPSYFASLGVPVVAGRAFTAHDDRQVPGVVIVNEQLVRRHFGGRNALGQRLVLLTPWRSPAELRLEVVGVVGDTRHYGIDTPVQEQIYMPYAQFATSLTTLLVKTAQPPEAIVPAIRRVVTDIDPQQPVSHVQTMGEAIGAKLAKPRLSAALLAAFATLALLLAAAGVFALFSYLVGQRIPEMGLRLALGAQRYQVLGLVFSRGMRIAAFGLIAGFALAWPFAYWLQSLLYGVEPHDPLTFAVVAAVVLAAALLACLSPARRAARVDPATALRAD